MNNIANQGTYKSMVCNCGEMTHDQFFFKPSFKFCEPESFSPHFNYNNTPCAPEDMVIIYDGGGVDGYN